MNHPRAEREGAWRRPGVALVVAALGAVITWRMAVIVYDGQRQHAEGDFQGRALIRMEMIHNGMANVMNPLIHLGKLATRDTAVMTSRFTEMANSIPMTRHPGILAFACAPSVTHSGRDAFEAMAGEELPGYRLLELAEEGTTITAKARDEYFPVLHHTGKQANALPFGLDLGSLPPLRRTMDAALRDGRITLSPGLTLPWARDEGTVVFAFNPISRKGSQCNGFITGVLRVGPLLDSALDKHAPVPIDLDVLDVSDVDQPQLLYHHRAETAGRSRVYRGHETFRASTRVKVAGRTWEVVATAVPDAFPVNLQPVYVTLASGLIVTMLLVIYLLGVARQMVRTQGMADELERKVAERTRELAVAQEELVRKEKLSTLGQVAGSVGHELRNPLGVMNNAVYFLQTVLPEADPITKEYLGIIKDEIGNADRIVGDLLDSVRTKPPQLRPVMIGALVGQITSKIAVPAGVNVTIDLPDSLPAVNVDPGQVSQVFRNLVTNAIDAMPQGGNLEISAIEDTARGMLTVKVKDSGAGIAPENLEKLFQPLFTTKARGIGLGLVVVKNLTENNGGTVAVESELGKGSTFMVNMPIFSTDEAT